MKILFVHQMRSNMGSVQALYNYAKIGSSLGHKVAVYGRKDEAIPKITFSTDINSFDYVIFVFESNLGWISQISLINIMSKAPKEKRLILDADGAYNDLIVLDYDRNHASEYERLRWIELYEHLSDKIYQPTLNPLKENVGSLLFYGYDPSSEIQGDFTDKEYDVMHVGHNWWRWKGMKRMLGAIENIRGIVGRICFVGSWWDAAPSWAPALNLEMAFRVDRDWLQRLRIQVRPPVHYTQVIPTMSEGRVNIMTQRPLLRHLRLLTSKYFEVFCANTIPLLMLDPDRAEEVYGSRGKELVLGENVEDKILDVLADQGKYIEIVHNIQEHLRERHSYEKRFAELISVLER